jgi:nitrogen fixation protein NifU and related proteins
MKLETLYQEIILDHYRHPHRHGLRDPFDAEVHHVNPVCGDEVTLRVHLAGEGVDATVDDVSYDAVGCSISQAATSVLTDLVVDRPVKAALSTLDSYVEMIQGRGQVEPDEDVLEDAVAFAGVARYPARVKCALLGWMAFKDAVARAVQSAAQSAVQSNEGEAP